MSSKTVKSLWFGAVPLLLVGATALGGEGVDVIISNDGTDDIVVTVYDMSVGPNAVVLSHARISGFTTVPVSVSPDANGRANLSWTAMTTDANFRKCGHEEGVELANSSSLTVHADGNCVT